MRKSHSSGTSENAANVNSQKRHCSFLAWLWCSEALQKCNLYAIAHGMMVLPHQSETPLCWCKLHSLYQYHKLEHQTHTCAISKTLQNKNWKTSEIALNAYATLHSTARICVYRCRNLLASPDFHFKSRNLSVPRSLGCRRW